MHYLSARPEGRRARPAGGSELVDLLSQWRRDRDDASERQAIWHQMLDIYTQQVFSIGIVNGTLQPVVASASCRTCRRRRSTASIPTCYLGVYMPDTFWLTKEA